MKEQIYISIYTGNEPFFRDHIIGNEKVFPATAYIELVRAAGENFANKKVNSLKNIYWLNPIKIQNVETKIITKVFENGNITEFEVFSELNDERKVYCRGEIDFQSHPNVATLEITTLKDRTPHQLSGEDCYALFKSLGLNYGKTFRGIKKLSYNYHEVFSQLELENEDDYFLAPGLLDSALQSCIGLNIEKQSYQISLPYHLSELLIYKSLPERVWCHVERLSPSSYNIDLFDSEGVVLLSLKGFSVLPLKTPNIKDTSEVFNPENKVNILYKPSWKTIVCEPNTVIESTNKHLIISRDSNQLFAQKLADFIEKQGNNVILAKLETEITDDITHIYFLQGLSKNTSQINVRLSIEEKELSIFNHLKRIFDTKLANKKLSITAFTANTQKVVANDVVRFEGGGIIGLLGSLEKEKSNWDIRVVDVDYRFIDNLKIEILLSPPFQKSTTLYAIRNHKIYQCFLNPINLIEKPSRIKNNGTYIILGGAGGIGRATSEYLIRKYKAKIIWLGRSPQNSEITYALDQMEKLGQKPQYIQCDANNPEELEVAYQNIKKEVAEINGLFHSAIVLNDMLIKNMTIHDFQKSFYPKSLASHNLVETFKKEPLDFVCFYSSLQSQTNGIGQANYSAGCTYKDSFAWHIKDNYGLPISIINWGYWGEVGIVSDDSYRKKMESLGIGSINTDEGMLIVEKILSNATTQVAAIKLSESALKSTEIIDSSQTIIQNKSISTLNINAVNTSDFIIDAKVSEAFETICGLGLIQALNTIGFEKIIAENTYSENFHTLFNIKTPYDRFFKEVIRKLIEINLLKTIDSKLQIPNHVKQRLKKFDLKSDVEKSFSNNDYKAHINLLEICLDALPNILVGKVNPVDIIFPNASLQLVSGIYKGNYQADYFNHLLSDIVEKSIENTIKTLGDGQKIRILEVGAGTGGTSQIIFERIKPFSNYIEYHYTDISKSFLFHAEKEFRELAPYLKTTLFNIEQPPANQNIDIGEFDLIIGANVIHATKNIVDTLTNIKQLLKTDGAIILNEISDNKLFNTLTFGLLDGWWLYEDDNLRLEGSPALSVANWKYAFEAVNFHSFVSYPQNSSASQQIIVAKSDGLILQNTILQTPTPLPTKPFQNKNSLNKNTDKIDFVIEKFLKRIIGNVLKMQPELLDSEKPIIDYGIDSIIGIDIIKDINDELGTSIATTILFDFPTLNQLTAYLQTEYADKFVIEDEKEIQKPNTDNYLPITQQQNDELSENINEGIGQKLWVKSPGRIDDIELVRFNPQKPTDEEAIIEIKSFSINFGDLLCIKGLYPTMPPFPFTPGFEASGIITEVGNRFEEFAIGDEVIVMGDYHLGMHASHITAHKTRIFRKPSTLSFAESCSLPVVSTTMIEAFKRANPKIGETILIQTATGGTGLITIQLALNAGLQIIATAGSNQKLDYLRSIGIDKVINYLEYDFEEEVRKITNGKGVDIVVNTLSGENVQKGINCLAKRGRYVELSMTALKSARSIDISKFSENQTFIGLDLRKLIRDEPEYGKQLWEECLDFIDKQVLQSITFQQFNIRQYKEAYRTLENRSNIGKVVVNFETNSLNQKDKNTETKHKLTEDIAIIGISGQFGSATDLDEFWEVLKNGKSLIEEVPSNRWSVENHFSANKNEIDKTYCKWGSFLNDIDKFDPAFFRISGIEAENMDPQQRIFLQHTWKAIEDAAINPESLNDTKCGVFVGAVQGDYLHSINQNTAEASSFWGNSSSVLASRISYYLNLKGAAIAVDTACSSSLVAIDLACKSLQMGETDISIAGGISIFISPHFYKQSSKAGMLSPNGTCYAFDSRANGFVPGEGVGVVVLKRVRDAIRDKDAIYAVIKGITTNQDGTTSGITAPSMISQRNLEIELYKKTGINPETISYVEAHGTGTSLGDPIEFQALTSSFKTFTQKTQFCGLGSVKSNIGHTVMAAGIAGVIKVLLAMKHKSLPPTINFHQENSMINLKDSPFKIQKSIENWTTNKNAPRRATVSSFGFSGTNAHLILEEYPQNNDKNSHIQTTEIVPISAKNRQRVFEMALNLRNFIEKNKHICLSDLAFTLQNGRKELDERIVFVVNNLEELITKLDDFLSNKYDENLQNNIKTQSKIVNETVLDAISDVEMAKNWVLGHKIDWLKIKNRKSCQKLHLPTYPFAKESYWLAQLETSQLSNIKTIHPLLHQNHSTIYEQKFISTFSGSEKFLQHHQVNAQKILPGVAYLEMVREAGEKSFSQKITQIKDVTWLSPIVVNGTSRTINLTLKSEIDNQLFFNLYSENSQLHSKGSVSTLAVEKPELYNLSEIRQRLTNFILKDECYSLFSDIGLEYGDSFRGIQTLYYHEKEALSKIVLKKEEGYILTVGILDCALQTCVGTSFNNQKNIVFLPFHLEEMSIYREFEEDIWCYVKEHSDNSTDKQIKKYDINILTNNGEVILSFKKISFLSAEKTASANKPLTTNPLASIQAENGTLFIPLWERIENAENEDYSPQGTHLIIAPNTNVYSDTLIKTLENNSENSNIIVSDKLSEIPNNLTNIYFLQGVGRDGLNIREAIQNKEISIFHDIKTLIASGYGEKPLNITIFTLVNQKVLPTDTVRYEGGGISGLVGSVSKEQIHWNFKIIDLENKSIDDSLFYNLLKIKFDKDEILFASRKSHLYRRTLYDTALKKQTTKFRYDGTYLILGGAGGIGRVTSEFLVREYNAQVIWLGRSSFNDKISTSLDEIEAMGKRPIYIQCDATNQASLQESFLLIKKQVKQINGIFHSAIILNDMLLKNMDDKDFSQSFDVKSVASHNLIEAFKNEPLDFVCFYSSTQSQVNLPGQSNYSAACTYKDSFAHFIRDTYQIPSYIINWGYWGEIGIVSSEEYQHRMKMMGVGSITNKDGMEALEVILSNNLTQVITIKFI